MRVSELSFLSEASGGYRGGTSVDVMPNMSLEEATGSLPCFLMESQMDLISMNQDHTEAITEAAIAGLHGGRYDIGFIVEGVWDTIKEKIKKIFKKIADFLKSIVAKLQLFIDKMLKSGHDLYEKYKEDKRYKGKNYKGMTVTGYRFKEGERPWGKLTEFAKKEEMEKVIGQCVGTEIKDPKAFLSTIASDVDAGWAEAKDKEQAAKPHTLIQEKIDKMNDYSVNTFQKDFANKITKGKYSLRDSSWSSDIRKALYGNETELKYGSDFSETTMARLLGRDSILRDIKDEYDAIKDAVESYETELTRSAEECSTKANATATTEVEKAKAYAQSDLAAYYNAYLQFVNNSYSVITTLKGIETTYEEDRIKQAKTIFGKMLSWKPETNNSDAAQLMADMVFYDVDF